MPKFRCPKCNNVFEGPQDKCPHCGVVFKKTSTQNEVVKKEEHVSEDLFCPKCGSPVTQQDNYCSKCGTKLKDEEKKTERNAGAIVALVLGSFSASLAIIALTRFLVVGYLSFISFALSVASLVISIIKIKKDRLAIGGLVFAIIALIISIVCMALYTAIIGALASAFGSGSNS